MSVDISGTPSVDLVGELDQQVRSVVRREGVDPQLDVTRVRRIAEDVVRAHDERSLTGAVAPVSDVDSMVGELVEFGTLTPASAAFLEASVKAGLNILVAGSTQVGNSACA